MTLPVAFPFISREESPMPSMRNRDGERGQILILFAGGLVVLLLILGLVVDGGTAYVNRRDGQNSADLAALAGTKKLVDTWRQTSNPGVYPVGNGAYQAIATSLAANDCPLGGICTWTAHYVGPRSGATFQDLGPVQAGDANIPGWNGGTKAIGVKVDVTRTPRTYFLGVIGQSTWTVGTAATAIAGKTLGAPVGQLMPIAFVDTGTVPDLGAITALTSGANGPGNFGWVSWTGSNSSGGLSTSLCTPDNPAFILPAQFPGDPGTTNASDVRACLQQWVDNGETVLIPIVWATDDPLAPPGCKTGANGNNFTFCIKAIAAFKITGYTQPAVDQINGMYQGTYAYSGSIPAGVGAPPTATDKFYYFGLAQ
jgi:Putative Flp pilus-assembly TadE/G-like